MNCLSQVSCHESTDGAANLCVAHKQKLADALRVVVDNYESAIWQRAQGGGSSIDPAAPLNLGGLDAQVFADRVLWGWSCVLMDDYELDPPRGTVEQAQWMLTTEVFELLVGHEAASDILGEISTAAQMMTAVARVIGLGFEIGKHDACGTPVKWVEGTADLACSCRRDEVLGWAAVMWPAWGTYEEARWAVKIRLGVEVPASTLWTWVERGHVRKLGDKVSVDDVIGRVQQGMKGVAA